MATEDRSTALSDMLQHSGFDLDIFVGHDHAALRSMSPNRRKKLNDALSQLPHIDVCQSLVQVYFDEANWYYTMLDRFYFDEAYHRWTLSSKEQSVGDRDVMYFPALLFQVLAIALDYVPPTSACKSLLDRHCERDFDSLSSRWANAGETVMAILGRRQPTVISVQADLVRCAWLKNAGHGAEGNSLWSIPCCTVHILSFISCPSTCFAYSACYISLADPSKQLGMLLVMRYGKPQVVRRGRHC